MRTLSFGVQYYRDAARATLSMEAPKNIGAKTSTASGGKATVEMGQSVSGPDKTPDKQAQSDVMKQKVTELLMTLSVREQEVCIYVEFFSLGDMRCKGMKGLGAGGAGGVRIKVVFCEGI